jgi:hypothetical protein
MIKTKAMISLLAFAALDKVIAICFWDWAKFC